MPIFNRSPFGCMVLIVLITVIVSFYGCGRDRNQVTPPTELGIIQPSGRNPQTDFADAQTNLLNMQAYKTYQEGNAVIIDAQGNYLVNQGQADLLHAQACEVRNDCGLYNFQQGTQQAAKDDWMLPAITFGGVALGLAFLFTRK